MPELVGIFVQNMESKTSSHEYLVQFIWAFSPKAVVNFSDDAKCVLGAYYASGMVSNSL